MKTKTFKRIVSLSLAAATMLGGVYQVGVGSSDKYVSSITAEAEEECTCAYNDYCFNCYVENMNNLYELAGKYLSGDNVVGNNYKFKNKQLWFTFAYLRRLVYCKNETEIDNYGDAAGIIEFQDVQNFTNSINNGKDDKLKKFISYLIQEGDARKNHKKFTSSTFHIGNMKEKFEIGHMSATVSACLYDVSDYITQVCGWAGDFHTLMNDADAKAGEYDGSREKAFEALMGSDEASFSTNDLFSDVAACEIGKIVDNNRNINMKDLLKKCFDTSDPKVYIKRFSDSVYLQDVMRATSKEGIVQSAVSQIKASYTPQERKKLTTIFSNYLLNNYGSALKNEITIKRQPETVCVPMGGDVKAKIEATGANLVYKWYYKDANMTDFKLAKDHGSTYQCQMTEESAGRQIYCEVRDNYYYSTTSKIITIGAPVEITNKLSNVSVEMGEELVVNVDAKGCGLTYEWYYKNSDMSEFKITDTFKGSTYRLKEMTNQRNGRQIYCVVKDMFENEAKTDTITLSGN